MLPGEEGREGHAPAVVFRLFGFCRSCLEILCGNHIDVPEVAIISNAWIFQC